MDKNLVQRIITGTVFIIVLVGCIMWNAWSMAGLFLLITILGLREFYKLSEKAGVQPQKGYGIFFGIVIYLIGFISKADGPGGMMFIILPLLFLPFFIELFRKKENPFVNIGWTFLGVLYVAIPFSLLVNFATPGGLFFTGFSKETHYYSSPLLTIFVLIWISDTMAYVCGRLFGKHKLWERISPKKTWEGFIGGFIFTVVAGGMIANWILYNSHNYSQEIKWICVAAVISVTGMLGDLVESLFKRSINVKDSGTILPGHGGILDRFDALLLATPFALTTYYICDELLMHHYF
ncbi:phosphatidate cytidylyltransferase [soil metagenome]